MSPQYSIPRYSAPRRASSRNVGRIARSITSPTSSSPTNGTGAYAPMPPVFGPSSLSNARLWSCAVAQSAASRPSHSANSEISGPVMPSSITQVRPASPNASPDRYAWTASRASPIDSVTMTPLPCGEPVGLHDVQAGQRLEERERTLLPAGGERAVPRGRHGGRNQYVLHPRLRAFERGRRPCAARTRGGRRPPPRRPRRRRAGPRAPRPRGRHRPSLPARRRRWDRRPRPSRHSPIAAIPGLPGAHTTSSTCGERAKPHASACSRPPAPTTRTRVTRLGATRSSGRAPGRHRRC